MSGICGMVGKVETHLLDRICDSISHRGQHKRILAKSNVALGIQLWQPPGSVPPASLPAKNEQNTVWAVLDGDFYNHDILCAELETRGHRFRHYCRSEILVHAYEEFGLDCPIRLDGPFAFAIWDDVKKRLVLGRDRFGMQPLYYAKIKDTLLFGSEIKAILQYKGIERRVNETALWNYLGLLHVPGPETIFQGIHQVEPASTLVYHQEQLHTQKYWHPNYQPKKTDSPKALCQYILDSLRQAVEKLVVSEAPLTLMLSGGVDSGAVLALAQKVSNLPIHTFTSGVKENSESVGGNVFPIARLTAEHIGSIHHKVLIDASDVLDSLPEILWHFDEPYAGGISTYFVAREIQKYSPYVLSGTGADILFSLVWAIVDGYDWLYRYQRQPKAIRLLPSALSGLVGAGMATFPFLAHRPQLQRGRRFLQRLETDIPTDLANKISRWQLDPSPPQICAPSFANQVRPAARWDTLFAQYWATADTNEAKDAGWYASLQTVYADEAFKYVDRLTMAHGLKHRSPFTDYQLVDLAEHIPTAYREKDGKLKPLLRAAFQAHLPDQILHGDNPSFSLPYDVWLRGPWADFARDLLLSPKCRQRGYFEPAEITRLVNRTVNPHLESPPVPQVQRVWNLMMLELWFRIYLDGQASSKMDLPRI